MCIQTRIEKIQAQKAALDAQITKLEQLEIKTAPVKTLLLELLADYSDVAPEDLAAVWQEVLAIGQKFNLSVQPLDLDELRQWEAANAENEKLKRDAERWSAAAAISELAVIDLRSQLAQIQMQQVSHEPIVEKSAIREELENLYEEALTENTEEVSDSIPALTLWQPWASLIVEGVKRIETRSWATSHRGPIAIHAAKRDINIDEFVRLRNLLPDEIIWTAKGSCEFPLGAVLAIANLIDCVEMTPEFIAQQSEQELKCGDWQPGRFAWILEIIRPVVPPVQVSGGQKLWNWSGTSIAAELEYLEKLKAIPEPETVDSILTSHGFFMPDINLGDCYDPAQKYETYRGWDNYRSCQDKGIDGIGLYNEQYGFWDASTEMIGEDDPTFPEDFTDGDAILAWTRKVIDQVVAVTPVQGSEVPGQLALEFPDPEAELSGGEYNAALDDEGETILITFQEQQYLVEVLNEFASGISILIQTKNREQGFTATVTRKDVENNNCSLAKCAEQVLTERLATQKQAEPIAQEANTEPAKLETESNFEAMGFNVRVYPQYAGENNLVGATFRFLTPEEMGADGKPTLVFATSLLAAEIGELSYRVVAEQLIMNYQVKETARLEKLANPHAKEEDKFIELVKITPAVGYIKRKDNGELLSAYAAFANRDAAGEKTTTMAKPRAKKWAEHLHASFETCGWKVEEPRKVKRMVAELGAKQQFAYEIKITGKFSIEQLQLLAQENFSLLPGEVIATPKKSPAFAPQTSTSENYRVVINGYEIASGEEEEMRSFFATELKTFGSEGRVTMCLMLGQEIVEGYNVKLFNFVPAQDFDEQTPEYFVLHRPTQTNFRVYQRLQATELSHWTNSVYSYSNRFSTREAAAVDAVRRLLKAQDSAE